MQTSSKGFNKFDVTEATARSSQAWQDENMYKTSYYKQSEQNKLALQNSTKQFLNTFSDNLKGISARESFHYKPVENSDFIHHDYNNLYRTSYTDMSQKLPKLTNNHYIPGYKGFVPGLVSENAFAANYSKLAKEKIKEFDDRRFEGTNTSSGWQYQPLSKTHGNFWRKNVSTNFQSSLRNHDYTSKLRDSGYSTNHTTCDKKGWVPISPLHGDMVRTEYRIRYNVKKDIHYKGPIISTGKLKKKEYNYKHT